LGKGDYISANAARGGVRLALSIVCGHPRRTAVRLPRRPQFHPHAPTLDTAHLLLRFAMPGAEFFGLSPAELLEGGSRVVAMISDCYETD
jgi:hypothetical protein